MSAGGVLLLPRLLVVVWGLLLPHSLLLVQVSGMEVRTWYKTQVSKGKLEAMTPTEITSQRIIECAVMASQDPETHLFCHPDAATCSFYDIKVKAGHTDSSPVQDCWTKHTNVCESGGQTYEEGETFVDSATCSTFLCSDGINVQQSFMGDEEEKVKVEIEEEENIEIKKKDKEMVNIEKWDEEMNEEEEKVEIEKEEEQEEKVEIEEEEEEKVKIEKWDEEKVEIEEEEEEKVKIE
ncbi:hypothetical protein Pmani_025911 [Petrolisthes manimaculis]|uniref:Uncharacterized protein n=1 Tax=Petrolisthes manimaculis TaxID=1843537 RepID=A0AAE1P6X3_9EUCA|nr:hypothetical protein Pmani_025911 [Petrolisthes manimaculis]